MERAVPRGLVRPLAALIRPMVRLVAGFDLKEASTEEALAVCDRPVLFVHGLADELVPHEMSARGQCACRGPSRLVSVPDAGHGLSFVVDEAGCRKACEEFLRDRGDG